MGPRTADVEELYSRYAPMVFRRAYRLLGSEGDAWDAVHDVFVHLMEKGWSSSEVSHPVTFIHRVTTNHCLNKLRGARRSALRVQALGHVTDAGGNLGAAGQVDAREFVDRLAVALGDRQRAMEIAVYRYLDDMTLDEVADTMQVSRKTVQRDLELIEKVAADLGAAGPEQA